MEERDRIDIIATLHDRFNKPADEIIRKMERMESQADETGESVDEMSDSLDNETKSAKDSSRATEENTKARRRSTKALDDQAKAISTTSRNFIANTEAVKDSLSPIRKSTKAQQEAAKAAEALEKASGKLTEAVAEQTKEILSSERAMDVEARVMRRARDARGRFIRTVERSTDATREQTKATEESTRKQDENTESTEKNRKGWAAWDAKIRKIASNAGKRFRPIGAFFQNYFKIIGAFRAILFSDIGAMIPQLITGLVAIGAAANATLGPLGRMAGTLGQIAPLIAAFAQAKFVFGAVTKGIKSALDVMQDTNATAEELAEAQEAAGKNTWEFAKYVTKLQDKFLVLKRTVRETFLEGMLPVVKDLVGEYMPLLTKELTNTAKIMNGELKEGLKGLMTPEKKGTIADVMERSSVASGLFVDIAFSLLDVFIELADAAGPAFLETLEAIDGKLDKFAGWIRDNKDGLTDFFLRANDTAGEFFRGIGGILSGLHGISQAAKPLSDFLYGGLADRLVAWGEKMNDPAQQEIMRKGYEAMIPNLEAIGNLIGSIIDGAKEIATSEFFAPLINDLADNGIPMMVDYIKKLDETVGPPLLRISQALDDIDPEVLTSILQPLGDMLGVLATVLETVVPLFNALPEPMQKMVMYGLGLAAMGLPGFFILLMGPVAFVIRNFETLSKLFEKLKNSKLGKFIGGLAKKFKAFFKPIGDFMAKHLGKGAAGGILAKIFGKIAGKGILAAAGPVGIVIGVLWLLWDVISYLWNNVEPFRDFMVGVWDWIKRAWHASIDWIVNSAVPWIVGAFQDIWQGIKDIGQAIADFWNKYIQPVIDALVFAWKFLAVLIGTIVLSILAVIVFLWDKALKPFVVWLWNDFVQGMKDAWDDIKAITGALVDGLTWLWDGLVGIFVWLWDKVLKPLFKWLADVFVTGVGQLWADIKTMTGWLVDSLTWLWNGFVAVLKWVWLLITDYIVKPAVVWFMTYVWPMIKWVIDKLIFGFNWLKDGIALVWSFIKDKAVTPVANWFNEYLAPKIKGVTDTIKAAFDVMKDGIGIAWDWLKEKIANVYYDSIKPIFDFFGEAITSLKDSFAVAVDAIGLIWQGLKDKVRGPAQYVVDVVYNDGIRKIWNELSDAVGLGVTLSEITFGGGTGGNENKQTTNMGGGRTAQLYTGGMAEERAGGWTGPGSKYQPAGVVHADEFVVRKSSQRDISRKAPGFLDDLNRNGARALGYDSGGWVKPFKGSAGINSDYGMRGGRMHSGVDFPVPSGTALTAVSDGSIVQRGYNSAAGNKISMQTDMKGIVAGYHHLSRYAAALGQQVTKNQVIGYSGNTGRSSGAHLHFSIKKDGSYVNPNPYLKGSGSAGTGEGGGGFSLPNPFSGVLDGYLNGFGKFGANNGFVDLMKSGVTKMVSKVTDFVTPFLSYVGDKVSDAGDWVMYGGDGGANVERWKSTAVAALKHTGTYSEANLNALLRRMNQESGGNPRAINNTDSNAKKGINSRGLMQVIPPTFRTYRDKSLSTDIYDPMANIVASINYAEDRYGNLLSAYNRRGGYAHGGKVTAPNANTMLIDHMRFMGGPVETWGNTLVGEMGPEIFMPSSGAPASILGLHGPEVMSFDREGSVLPHQAVEAIHAINSEGGGGTTYEGDTIQIDVQVNGDGNPQDIERAVRTVWAKLERQRKERR